VDIINVYYFQFHLKYFGQLNFMIIALIRGDSRTKLSNIIIDNEILTAT